MTQSNEKNKLAGRRDNRIAAMQFLYMRDFNKGETLADSLNDFFETKDKPREYFNFAEELVSGFDAHSAEVDAAIEKNATNWTMDRMAKVDLSILRLAVFELLFRDDIPPVVSINEAIDLAKDYSSKESRRFINGVLDKIKTTLTRPLRTANQ